MPRIVPPNPVQLLSGEVDNYLDECRQEYNEYQKEKIFRTRRIGTTLFDKLLDFEACVDEFRDFPNGEEGWELAKAKAEFFLKLADRIKLPDPNQNVNRNINETRPTGPSRPDVIVTREELLAHGQIMLEAQEEERQFKEKLKESESPS